MKNLQQKKLLAVANALGISDISNMQGSTRVVYDEIARTAGATEYTFFRDVASRSFPNTNLTTNRFEVQEALLIEAVAVYGRDDNSAPELINFVTGTTAKALNGLLDIIIGNKRVMKENLVTGPTIGQTNNAKSSGTAPVDNGIYYLAPTVGIVIPPQIEFECQVKFSDDPGTVKAANSEFDNIGIALYGTGVLLNLNMSL